ncbi:MAG: OB-fold nucleic acid binding domain-containing protein [Acidimicrobiaceae bacterium]|nr:OB-fold nucleic acid binding domain-containing protein [Acidimicrobiaceae bacterium]
MGLRGFGKRLSTDKKEIDTERLCKRFDKFDFTRLGELQCRTRTKVAGEIKRIRIKPRSGIPSVEIVINDGTGEATVVFSGRRNIPGIDHGRCLMIDGVPHRDRDRIVMLNPAYTLLG